MLTVRQRASPNFDPRPPGQAVDILLLHYTAMESAEAALLAHRCQTWNSNATR